MKEKAPRYKLAGDTVYQTKTGWRAIASFRTPTGELDDSGKPVYEWTSTTKRFTLKSKKVAKKAALEWVEELNHAAERTEARGAHSASTVGDYVTAYIDDMEGKKEKSTINGYRRRARYIEEGLGGVDLDELTKDMVGTWLNKLAKKLSAQSANDAFVLLKAAMNDAELEGVIERNPAARVKKLKVQKAEPNVLDGKELARLVEDLAVPRVNESAACKMGIKLALFTGMRQGEICGLRWRNVDFEQGIIRIREAVGRDGDGAYIKEPKTAGSRRDVPVPSFLLDELEQMKADMRVRCIGAGVPFSEAFFVTGEIDGSFMNPRLLFHSWQRRVKRLGLVGNQGKAPAFHDLRHTFATVAIANGADVKSVSSLLGHTDASVTLNVYASSDPDAKRRAMDDVSRAMLEKVPATPILEYKPTGTEGR